ncbi:energy-coupling factor ABC transporter ATP-binding protein [Neobacillus drentensis]|uniref:energy-coupling factor ABC transporter ATP-binding protein n=1 Tax=Neobacillus drentensis TaxID=220684 RepID=UPI000825383C|nr:ABC transporter ATP-binding protein [Neobacillus drentensis]
MAFLTLTNLTYAYPNGFTAVENVTMSFEKGESVAIVGQNGAGKTTTVKLINGLLKPTEGDVMIDGWNTKDYTTAQISRKVGYVFQNPDDQIFNSTVYKEIEFGPKQQGLSLDEVKERVLHAAELVGVTKFLEENPYDLPYSLRKMVTIAAVIAMNTDVIILDEPTAGQDYPTMIRLGAIIKHLNEQGKTVITITHDMEFVVNHFEHVIVMANKRKIADGNKRDIFWDHETLEKSMLKQPHISRLSHSLKFGNNVLTIDEIVDELKEAKKNGHAEKERYEVVV